MTEIFPVATQVICHLPKNGNGAFFDVNDDISKFPVDGQKVRGLIGGCFPLGFMEMAIKKEIIDTYKNSLEILKKDRDIDYRAIMFYVILGDDGMFYMVPSLYVERDEGKYN